jgi:putative ABC transport system ATP-binding protein
MPTLISLRSVGRTYNSGAAAVYAVRDVSFDIQTGERLAIMGPSGSGKSTLMNLIGLLDAPTHGEVLLDGQSVADLSKDEAARLRARKIGFVFQSYNLLARHSALENVALPLIYCGIRRKERLARAEAALHSVGLLHRAQHLPAQLSGGEQQRIAIARAIVANPTIILADEPTGALDSKSGADILSLLRSLNRIGHTVVMITHDPTVAAQCKRTLRLRDGELIADDTHLPQVSRLSGVA